MSFSYMGYSEEKIRELIFNDQKAKSKITIIFQTNTIKYGTIKLEEWPEGLVLWVGGKIVYKSQEN